MTENIKKGFVASGLLFAIFVVYTLLVSNVDVRQIGPSTVGFSKLNDLMLFALGTNLTLYTLTDWMSLFAVIPVLCFAIMGLVQMFKRKSILKVDSDILAMGCFYVLLLMVYLFFENVVINYRPLLIDGAMEASYPSSTTMLMLCVMPTAMMQARWRLVEKWADLVDSVIGVYMMAMVVMRALSGVHWFTDIVGGIIISAALVTLYWSTASFLSEKLKKKNA